MYYYPLLIYAYLGLFSKATICIIFEHDISRMWFIAALISCRRWIALSILERSLKIFFIHLVPAINRYLQTSNYFIEIGTYVSMNKSLETKIENPTNELLHVDIDRCTIFKFIKEIQPLLNALCSFFAKLNFDYI